ncbi:MAG: hypothetical protein KME64_18145 [Scytonematopsis contorta HA4267-MV1]|jgi:hypothetical protein|nr:hypothetical protein [Scytonematopsis contorta HA4267-MV1]
MEVYVQSRGYAQEHDYCWVDENRRIVEEPRLVNKFQYLIQREVESLLLARDKESNQLLLLLTGIKSEKRKDFQNRTIQISVAWLCESSKNNEQILSSLAISFLERELISKIDFAVNEGAYEEGENYGFRFSFNKPNQLCNYDSNSNKKGELAEGINNISESYKIDLIEELKSKLLPTRDGVLVVVTGIKSKSALQAKVWRGLAKLVDDNPSFDNNAQTIAKKN